MQKKKLLRICHKFLKDNDGYDLEIQDLVLSLSNEYDTYIAVFLKKEELDSYIKKNNLKKKENYFYHSATKAIIIPVFYESKFNNYLQDFYMFKNIKQAKSQLNNIIQQINPQIIHIHGTLLLQYLLVSAKHKHKTIATHHIGHINQNYHQQKLRILAAKFIVHNLFPFFCRSVICVSNHGRQSFLIKTKNIAVINPVPMIDESKKIDVNNNQKSIKLQNKIQQKIKNKSEIVLFYPARFCEQKNQLNLVKAFVKLSSEKTNLKLILAGSIKDQYYFAKIKDEAAKVAKNSQIIIMDELDKKKVHSLIKSCNYVVAPSINEGFGRIAREALAYQKPVIASNEGGYSDIIKDGVNGILVNPYDSKSIYGGIKTALSAKFAIVQESKENRFEQYISKIKSIYLGKQNEL